MEQTLLLSDLHLGWRRWPRWLRWLSVTARSRAADVLAVILFFRSSITRLIVNGDLFHDLESVDERSLNADEMRLLATLRELVREGKLVVTRGNHDPNIELVKSALGLPEVHERFRWNCGPHIHEATHFDQFDPPCWWRWAVADAVIWLYGVCGKTNQLKKSRRWLLQATRVHRRAVHYALTEGIHVIHGGHVHHELLMKRRGVLVSNSGCALREQPFTFEIIHGNGSVCLYEYRSGGMVLLEQAHPSW